MGVGFSPPLGCFGKNLELYCVILEGKMLSVFGFDFFRGSTSAIFRFFCRSTFVRSRFWKITLQSNFSDLLVS